MSELQAYKKLKLNNLPIPLSIYFEYIFPFWYQDDAQLREFMVIEKDFAKTLFKHTNIYGPTSLYKKFESIFSSEPQIQDHYIQTLEYFEIMLENKRKIKAKERNIQDSEKIPPIEAWNCEYTRSLEKKEFATNIKRKAMTKKRFLEVYGLFNEGIDKCGFDRITLYRNKYTTEVVNVREGERQHEFELFEELWKIETYFKDCNYITYKDICLDGEKYYLVMDCDPEANTLERFHTILTRENQQYNFEKISDMILKYIYQIITAVDVAHGKNLIMRNLKPGNIYFKNWKLAISGVRFFCPDDNYVPKQCVGTISFMSPECYLKNRYSKEADIFSFGAILLFLLTEDIERSGFSRHYKTNNAYISFLKEIDDISFYSYNGDAKEFPRLSFYKELIKKCMNKDPYRRPTALEIREELYSVITDNKK